MRSLILFLSFIVFLSCSNSGNRFVYEAGKHLNDFPVEYVSHFPSLDACSFKSYTFLKSTDGFPNIGKFISISYSIKPDELFYKYEDSLKSNASFIIRSFKNDSVYKKDGLMFDGIILHEGEVPFPYMRGAKYELKLLADYFPNSYVHYIMDAQQGKFLNENELINSDIVKSPWSHGFVRGVTISVDKKYLIAWTSIW